MKLCCIRLGSCKNSFWHPDVSAEEKWANADGGTDCNYAAKRQGISEATRIWKRNSSFQTLWREHGPTSTLPLCI